MEKSSESSLTNTDAIVAQYDPEMRFRQLSGLAVKITTVMMVVLSIFHLYTSGFGVLQEWRHRAFHLAFCLPLVFFLYSMRKSDTRGLRHFIYDMLYATVGSLLTATLFREIFQLETVATLALSLASFLVIVYFKRREYLKNRAFLYIDLVFFSAMTASLIWSLVALVRIIDFGLAFKDINVTLLIWSVVLFGAFAAIIFLFLLQWLKAAWLVISRRQLLYEQDNIPYFDVFLAIYASAISVYIFLEFNGMVIRAGLPSRLDLVVGAFAFLLILEGTRRSIGPAIPIIAILVLVNSYLGPYFLDIPGLSFFAHRGYSVERIIEHMFLGTEGIFGIPLGVVATFVFHFILFGVFISKTGLGQLFMDLAMALAGWSAGGPAKVAVISSALFGSISGSSVANTVTTGSFTIPLMRRTGYSPQFAGAVEASASTGGQIMPPIMGAAAFIMAEFLGIPYVKIAAAAVIPAIMYFFAVGFMVHLEAKKRGLVGLSREGLPRAWDVLKDRWLYLVPLVTMVYLLIAGFSPFLAAFWGIVYAVAMGQIHRRTYPLLIILLLTIPTVAAELHPFKVIDSYTLIFFGLLFSGLAFTYDKTERLSWLAAWMPVAVFLLLALARVDVFLSAFFTVMAIIAIGVCYPESKMRIPDILETMKSGAKNALAITAACACIGFIVGATTLTGIGLKFAAAVLELARTLSEIVVSLDIFNLLTTKGVALFFTMIFTALACFVLGMGIPTTAQYIIAVMIAAPALLQLGIEPLVAHMFVFFFAILADVTPPVALAAYAAAGISGGNPFRTGLTAFSLASAGFCIPFIFMSAPEILLLPTLLKPEVPFDYLKLLRVVCTMFMGIMALGALVIGYLRGPLFPWQRVTLAAAAVALLDPGLYTDIFGFVILASTYAYQRWRFK